MQPLLNSIVIVNGKDCRYAFGSEKVRFANFEKIRSTTMYEKICSNATIGDTLFQIYRTDVCTCTSCAHALKILIDRNRPLSFVLL